LSDMLYLASIWVIPIIVAITFHEAAHGFVAHLLGDETAWRLGRVSFNPLKHIDPVGTILLPGFLLLLHSPFMFGYAKPVPVNFRALRNPRRDMIWVAAAGPTMNIALAILHPTPAPDCSFDRDWRAIVGLCLLCTQEAALERTSVESQGCRWSKYFCNNICH
jgi:Zn-dependent protease